MPPSSRSPNKDNLRELFSRNDNEEIHPDLRRALAILQVHDLGGLEERFLGTDAFLKPWAVFRDSILVLQPDAMPQGTILGTSGAADGITRLELLWFYTQYDEDLRRYDPRADMCSCEYTPDSGVYGVIDKSHWHVQDYEKHLYAWLLQEFKVGKRHNPWGFDYFELRNICTAWEAVFVPIVDAVRASYSVRGRQHYGRLALFIENKCPSRLAFPEDNIGIAEGSLMSPTPFRIVSVPKRLVNSDGTTIGRPAIQQGVLTKKHYDEAERELRDVYPQYGGLVERPKFKHRVEEWLTEQRIRFDRKKVAEKYGEVKGREYQTTQCHDIGSPSKKDLSVSSTRQQTSHDGNTSPIKRYSDSIRRSLSLGISSKVHKKEPKSPPHNIMQQKHIADEVPQGTTSPPLESAHDARGLRVSSSGPPDTVIAHRPRPEQSQRNASRQSVYASIRRSNPFIDAVSNVPVEDEACAETNAPMYSSMGHSSDIPHPLQDDSAEPMPKETSPIQQNQPRSHARVPSYEGTEYGDEISLTNLYASRRLTVHTAVPYRPSKPSTRIPGPINPIPYAGHLRIASNDSYHVSPSKPVAWSRSVLPKPVEKPDNWPPKATPWPGFESDEDVASSALSESPGGWNSAHGQASGIRLQQLRRKDSDTMKRIVSKDNIRAALAGISRENSTEDLKPPVPKLPYATGQTENMGIGVSLRTYNKHMFPRKETSAGGLTIDNERRVETARANEIEMLNLESSKDDRG